MRLRSRPAAAPALPVVALLAFMAFVALSAGCATTPPPAPPPPAGLTDLMQRPAERALFDGLRAYDDGRYPQAEARLRQALADGLKNPHDQATAHKLLAFITCTSARVPDCEAEFRAARAADPGFALTKSESGHPVWGPVYRRVLP